MKSFTFLVFFSCLLLGTSYANSQPSDSLSTAKKYELGEKYIADGNFPGAVTIYESLIIDDPDNPVLNFYLGYCYLNTSTEQDKSVKYLQKAVDPTDGAAATGDDIVEYAMRGAALDNVPLEAHYFLGRAFHANYKFKEAVDVYEDLLPRIDPKEVVFISMVEREIEICENAIELTKYEIPMAVENVGDVINTEYSDHSPVLSADEQMLVFTSMRENGGEKGEEGQYSEDVYVVYKNSEGEWGAPQPIAEVNSEYHDASISLTTDGSQLYIYREGKKDDGDIYYSEFNDGNWGEPEKLGKTVNRRRYRETHASISNDGNSLYFSSNRPVGAKRFLGMWFGGYDNGSDIWVSNKLPDGTWGDAENLGETINTEYDEEAPFIHPNGDLYFSSRGHNTMGGYDVFVAKANEDGTFAEPENIGYPINTTEDDVFYVLSANNRRAYYASNQHGEESYGRSDIYVIGFSDENIFNMAALEGIVELCDEKTPDRVQITVTNAETDEVVGIYTPNQNDGEFVFLLPPNSSYKATYEAEGYETVVDSFAVEESESYYVNRQTVEMETIHLCAPELAGGAYRVQNVMFPLDVYDKFIQEESYDGVKEFAAFLKEHPDITVEINGYCCERGSAAYNLGLSRRRANFVKNMLVKEGVAEDNLSIKAHGYNDPIGINRNADGSFREESMRFNRRVEFHILESGSSNIQVIQVPIPDSFKIKQD